MKKLLKWFAILLISLIGLLAAFIFALPFLIDPNDFKDDITATVKQHTGRTLTIEGDIKLSVFPWLGLQLGKTQLSNADGFDQRPMIKLDNIQLGVKLLPLLRQELQTDQTTLDGLQINLQKLANGKNNWDDLLSPDPITTTPATTTAANGTAALPLAAFAIDGLKINGATIHWDNQQAKQNWKFSHVDINTGAITWGESFPLRLSLSIEAKHLQVRSEMKLATEITLYPDQRLELQDLKLQQQLWHPQLPRSPIDVKASLKQLLMSLEKQTLQLDSLLLQNEGLVIKTDAKVDNLFGNLKYEATLDIPEFNPRQLATAHNIVVLKDVPDTSFRRLQGNIRLQGDHRTLRISKLDIQFDDSHLTGGVALPALDPVKYRYNLSLDKFNLDHYLASTADSNVAATPAAGAAVATRLPLDFLRKLDVNGEFKLGQLQASNLSISAIQTRLKADKGIMRLHPLQATLYAGTYQGDLQLNAQGAQPMLSIDERLQGVSLGPLLKDLIGDDKLHGTTNLQATLNTRGSDLDSMRRQLNGTIVANMKDGYLKGVDIDYAQRKLRAQLKGGPAPAKPDKPLTGFSKLDANFAVINGLAQAQSLNAQLPHARMQGVGNIDLVREQLNMTLNFKFSSKVQGQAGKSYDELDRIALPVHLTGPLTQPEYDIDFDAALKTLLKSKLEKQKAEEKAKLEQKIQEEKQKLKEKLNEKASDLLKNLLKR